MNLWAETLSLNGVWHFELLIEKKVVFHHDSSLIWGPYRILEPNGLCLETSVFTAAAVLLVSSG